MCTVDFADRQCSSAMSTVHFVDGQCSGAMGMVHFMDGQCSSAMGTVHFADCQCLSAMGTVHSGIYQSSCKNCMVNFVKSLFNELCQQPRGGNLLPSQDAFI